MVFDDIAEGVAAHRAFVNAVHKHRIDVVAVGSGNLNGDGIAVAHDRAGRGHETALTRRRRHRVFVDGEPGRDPMIGMDIGKYIRFGRFHRNTVHDQRFHMITLIRNNAVVYTVATIHRGHIRRGDGAVLRCRQHCDCVFRHRKGGV